MFLNQTELRTGVDRPVVLFFSFFFIKELTGLFCLVVRLLNTCIKAIEYLGLMME